MPHSFWQAFFLDGHGTFLEGHGTLAKLWGPIAGPLVAIVSFVCSIGNVPLANMSKPSAGTHH